MSKNKTYFLILGLIFACNTMHADPYIPSADYAVADNSYEIPYGQHFGKMDKGDGIAVYVSDVPGLGRTVAIRKDDMGKDNLLFHGSASNNSSLLFEEIRINTKKKKGIDELFINPDDKTGCIQFDFRKHRGFKRAKKPKMGRSCIDDFLELISNEPSPISEGIYDGNLDSRFWSTHIQIYVSYLLRLGQMIIIKNDDIGGTDGLIFHGIFSGSGQYSELPLQPNETGNILTMEVEEESNCFSFQITYPNNPNLETTGKVCKLQSETQEEPFIPSDVASVAADISWNTLTTTQQLLCAVSEGANNLEEAKNLCPTNWAAELLPQSLRDTLSPTLSHAGYTIPLIEDRNAMARSDFGELHHNFRTWFAYNHSLRYIWRAQNHSLTDDNLNEVVRYSEEIWNRLSMKIKRTLLGSFYSEEKSSLNNASTGYVLASNRIDQNTSDEHFYTDSNNCTLLHNAASVGSVEDIEPLIVTRSYFDIDGLRVSEKGISVNWKCNNGQTPLHIAAERGFKLTTEELLRLGADTTIEDNNGLTPRDAALMAGHPEIANFLYQAEILYYHRQNSKLATINSSSSQRLALNQFPFK
jgi:hypothetical protein